MRAHSGSREIPRPGLHPMLHVPRSPHASARFPYRLVRQRHGHMRSGVPRADTGRVYHHITHDWGAPSCTSWPPSRAYSDVAIPAPWPGPLSRGPKPAGVLLEAIFEEQYTDLGIVGFAVFVVWYPVFVLIWLLVGAVIWTAECSLIQFDFVQSTSEIPRPGVRAPAYTQCLVGSQVALTPRRIEGSGQSAIDKEFAAICGIAINTDHH